MGAYINPVVITKEAWLAKYATPATELEVATFDFSKVTDKLPVVLLDNGIFTAAIGYCKEEVQVFLNPEDERPKTYYFAKIEDLKEVSEELEEYIKLGRG